jgi:hypothetical protein
MALLLASGNIDSYSCNNFVSSNAAELDSIEVLGIIIKFFLGV